MYQGNMSTSGLGDVVWLCLVASSEVSHLARAGTCSTITEEHTSVSTTNTKDYTYFMRNMQCSTRYAYVTLQRHGWGWKVFSTWVGLRGFAQTQRLRFTAGLAVPRASYRCWSRGRSDHQLPLFRGLKNSYEKFLPELQWQIKAMTETEQNKQHGRR